MIVTLTAHDLISIIGENFSAVKGRKRVPKIPSPLLTAGEGVGDVPPELKGNSDEIELGVTD